MTEQGIEDRRFPRLTIPKAAISTRVLVELSTQFAKLAELVPKRPAPRRGQLHPLQNFLEALAGFLDDLVPLAVIQLFKDHGEAGSSGG